MTRKDIEKAAQENITVFGDNNFNRIYPDKSILEKGIRDFFVFAATWRINSVWHNDLKIGEPKKPILVRFKNGLFMVFEDIRELKGIESEVEMFAYLEDLIPNTED